MLTLPRSARLVLWANAWLAGDAAPDDVLDAVRGGDTTPPEGLTVLDVLTRVRSSGCTGLRLALPAPGDPLGLGGPPELNRAALIAGEAAVAVGAPLAFVPQIEVYGPAGDRGTSVVWTAHVASEAPIADDLAGAERALKENLIAAAAMMDELDVASWTDEAAAGLVGIREGLPAGSVPSVYDVRAVGVLLQGLRLRAIADLALRDDGGAVTGGQAQRRRETLVPLERIGRLAVVAACGSIFEPGEPLGRIPKAP